MARVSRGVTARAKHKKVTKKSKGHYGRRKNVFRVAVQSVERSMQYAYRDRRNKKREFRRLWIIRINAAVRQHGLSYSKFVHLLKANNIEIDRKVLADMAVHNPERLSELIKSIS